jgi:hypothetical protein
LLHDQLRSVFDPDDDLGAVLDGITPGNEDRAALHETFDRYQLGDHVDGGGDGPRLVLLRNLIQRR